MTRIYIASALALFDRAKWWATSFREDLNNCEVVSTWHDRVSVGVDPTDHASRAACLANNLEDLGRANVLVFIADEGIPRASIGETVIAIMRGYRVIWVQGAEQQGANIFDVSSNVTIVRSLREAKDAIAAIEVAA